MNVLIYGAGQIAAGYDAPRSPSILTHAYTVNKHDDFSLLGFYDINAEYAEKAAGKWGGKAYIKPV